MATTKSTTPRRKDAQSAQEHPAVQVVQFPLECPKPRQMHSSEAVVIVREISKDAVKLFVMPKPDAVRSILNETFGSLGWAQRRYSADGRLWCAVGVFNPYMKDYCFRDAGALEGKHPGSPERWKEETSFMAAAELWGVPWGKVAAACVEADRQRYHGTAAHYAACGSGAHCRDPEAGAQTQRPAAAGGLQAGVSADRG